MLFDLIVSQGRIGDRSERTLEGAARTAQALEQRYGVVARTIGQAAPSAHDDWSVSLPQARDTLIHLGEAIATSIDGPNLSVMIANTCSASLATLPIVARRYPEAVILWVDAHGDFNTPDTTDTGYLGGMVLAGACGLWNSGHGGDLAPSQIIVVGARDVDAAEGELLSVSGVRVIAPEDASPASVLDAIGKAPVWIHVDWDAMEPGHIPADYKVPGGLLPAQLREIFAAIPGDRLLGFEIAEFHPSTNEQHNQAALATALEIIAPLIEMSPQNVSKRGNGIHPSCPYSSQ